MQTRWLLNIFLLLMVLALAGTVYFMGDRNNPQTRLTQLDKHRIQTIVIPREQGDIRLRKQAETWVMESPYQLPAHAFRIQRLLELLNTSADTSYALADLDLTQFGLKPPRAVIRFNDTEIQFGKTSPVNQQRYLRVENTLFLVDDQLYPLINAQPSSFVDVAPLPGNMRIHKISLPGFSLYKTEQGLWQSDSVEHMQADRIQQLIENWQSAQAFGVHGYMQRQALGSVDIEHADGRLHFDITSHEPWLILARPEAGVEYHLDAGFRYKLLQLPEMTSPNKEQDSL